MPKGDNFVIVGKDLFSTLTIEDFTLHRVPGGPVGEPTSVEPMSERKVAIATASGIYEVDVRTRARRLLWSTSGKR